MPTTYAIPDGRVVMAATLYTGTGASLAVANTVNGVNFQPDFVWVKGRSGATDHALYDSVRGTTKDLVSNATSAETTQATGLTAFGSTGFTVGALAKMNTSAATYVGWQWKAGGTAVSNTAGSITSSVSANTTAGFSVVTWTGTNANATIGHGLGVAPAMYITKQRSATGDWFVYHQSVGATKGLFLELTNAATTNTYFNNTSPTSTVFSIGGGVGGLNASGVTQVTYCFAPVAGYSAFGSYTGNGSADGPFVYLGFRPRWLMIKASSFAGESWYLFDTTRNTFNVIGEALVANQTSAEFSFVMLDVLSNGFKARTTNSLCNTSGATYIYMAFAENPFKYANAR
jgi:hypothetical protein